MESIRTRYATKMVNGKFYDEIIVSYKKRVRLPRKDKKSLKKAFGVKAYDTWKGKKQPKVVQTIDTKISEDIANMIVLKQLAYEELIRSSGLQE